MSKLIPTYIEQALRIEVLERAVIASEGDVERLERELVEAREQLRLCNVDQFEYICKCGLRVVSHQCKTDKEF